MRHLQRRMVNTCSIQKSRLARGRLFLYKKFHLFLRQLGYLLFYYDNGSVSFVSLKFLSSYRFGNRLTIVYRDGYKM